MKASAHTSTARRDDPARAAHSLDAVKSVLGFLLAMFLMIGTACTVPAFADEPSAHATETSLVPPAVAVAGSAHDGVSTFIDTIEAVIDSDASKVYAAQAQAQIELAQEGADPAPAQAPVVNELEDRTLRAANGPAAEPQTATPASAEPAQLFNVIKVGETEVPYVDSQLTATAPDSTAGIWWGSDSTTDGRLGYFIGHNPGVFTCLLGLSAGSPITVWDSDGNDLTYHVVDLFDIPNTTTLEQLQGRISGHGESIALQTCIQGGAYYRIIVAA